MGKEKGGSRIRHGKLSEQDADLTKLTAQLRAPEQTLLNKEILSGRLAGHLKYLLVLLLLNCLEDHKLSSSSYEP